MKFCPDCKSEPLLPGRSVCFSCQTKFAESKQTINYESERARLNRAAENEITALRRNGKIDYTDQTKIKNRLKRNKRKRNRKQNYQTVV